MKKIYFIFISLMIILLVIASKYDYQITDTLYGYLPVYASFVAIFGVVFYYLSACCAVIILSKRHYTISIILIIIIESAMAYNMLHEIENINFINITLVLIIVISSFLILNFFVRKHISNLANYIAISLLSLNALSLLTVGFFKTVWARPRYLYVKSGEYQFSKWYHPNRGIGHEDEVQSFISGHSAAIYNSLFIIFLIPQKYHQKAFVIILLCSFLMSTGRLFSGNHYLSDIVASAIIISTYFIIIYEITMKNSKNKVSK